MISSIQDFFQSRTWRQIFIAPERIIEWQLNQTGIKEE